MHFDPSSYPITIKLDIPQLMFLTVYDQECSGMKISWQKLGNIKYQDYFEVPNTVAFNNNDNNYYMYYNKTALKLWPI